MSYLLFSTSPWLLPLILILVLGLAIELPAIYFKEFASKMTVPDSLWNVIQGGVLTLVAFMLGISFSQSQDRFDARRQLVVTEANTIGTTWLRADQLPEKQEQEFRALLTDYTKLRLQLYQGFLTPVQIDQGLAKSDAEQGRLWATASSMLRQEPQNLGRSLLMSELNDTIDVSAEQRQALTHHVPVAIDALTLLLVILGAILIGLGFARAGATLSILGGAYIIASVMVITMMIDLDRPQKGFVKVNLDPLVVQLQSMR
ncbi:MAG TPA: hypothetical protein VFE16_06970 [Candidatus Cybelea sp.]|jgi:hypothetical protein|nr:hypothetical protein [Candidatus Cybelea sp.]